MPQQFENQQEAQVKDQTVSDETAQQKMDRVADKLARKPAQTENKFDHDNSTLFNK